MPVHPYNPYGEDPDDEEIPNIEQIINRILLTLRE